MWDITQRQGQRWNANTYELTILI